MISWQAGVAMAGHDVTLLFSSTAPSSALSSAPLSTFQSAPLSDLFYPRTFSMTSERLPTQTSDDSQPTREPHPLQNGGVLERNDTEYPSPPQTPPHVIAPLVTSFKTIWEPCSGKSSSDNSASEPSARSLLSSNSRSTSSLPNLEALKSNFKISKNTKSSQHVTPSKHGASLNHVTLSNHVMPPQTLDFSREYSSRSCTVSPFSTRSATPNFWSENTMESRDPTPQMEHDSTPLLPDPMSLERDSAPLLRDTLARDPVTCHVQSIQKEAPTLRLKPSPLDLLGSGAVRVEPIISHGESSREELFSANTPRHPVNGKHSNVLDAQCERAFAAIARRHTLSCGSDESRRGSEDGKESFDSSSEASQSCSRGGSPNYW